MTITHSAWKAYIRPPGDGYYPVPGHHRGAAVARRWDGDVWRSEIRPAPAGAELPRHRRRLFGFLRGVGWKLALAFAVSVGIATVLWAGDRHASHVSGVRLLLPLAALVATAATMVAFMVFLNRRVGFDRIPAARRAEIIRWGLASAVVAFVFAFGLEVGIPWLFGSGPKDAGWSALAGPAEETGKLLVPVALWFTGRFRLPREGYLLVLVCSCAFGVIEGVEYALSPEGWQPGRPALEILHPLLTGFIAAVAWQAAWSQRSIVTRAAVGAWAIAMIAHSTNDLIVFDKDAARVLSGITIAVVVLMYLLQKHSARQMVPPDNVGAVSPRWRPVAPARSTAPPPPAPAPAPEAEVVRWCAEPSPLQPRVECRIAIGRRAAARGGLRTQLEVPGLVAVDPAERVRGAVPRQPIAAVGRAEVDGVARDVGGGGGCGRPPRRRPLGSVRRDRLAQQMLLVRRRAPAAVHHERDAVARGVRRGPPEGREQGRVEVRDTRHLVVEDRRALGDGTVGLAERAAEVGAGRGGRRRGVGGRRRRRGRRSRRLVAEGRGDRDDGHQHAGDPDAPPPRAPPGPRCRFVGHAVIEGGALLPARTGFSIRGRYAPAR